MKYNFENIESVSSLELAQLSEINGGNLVKDIGYVCHAIYDGACSFWDGLTGK